LVFLIHTIVISLCLFDGKAPPVTTKVLCHAYSKCCTCRDSFVNSTVFKYLILVSILKINLQKVYIYVYEMTFLITCTSNFQSFSCLCSRIQGYINECWYFMFKCLLNVINKLRNVLIFWMCYFDTSLTNVHLTTSLS